VPRRLLIEGWRGIHHSYALVAQAHCLCLLGHPDVDLRFRDLPYHSPAWRQATGLFDAHDERAIAGIPAPEASFAPDATLTLQAQRQDFTAPLHGSKFVFGTPEHRVLLAENVAPFRSAAEVDVQVHVVTPSRWTALAYERFGFDALRVHVVPHGIDPAIVHPDEASRAAIRKALGLQDAFVFLCVGAMTPNKGIDLLLSAFAEVAQGTPDARLLLKGADDLYPSQDHVRASLNRLQARAREIVATRLLYQGNTLSARQMAAFLRAGDAYVAPYLAEGFNMPVLEAAASGVSVICTAGGPTDEFTDESFATRVRSRVVTTRLSPMQQGDYLWPDLAHLVSVMREAAVDPQRTRARGAAGARYVRERFTWAQVTEVLLHALFDARRE
jgi:glycosyltransferase involved in cell wall biosynthesis